MKLIIVRHGDPDYEHDSLTEKGWREAEYLSERLTKLDVKTFYVSPLGRARATIRPTLEKLGCEAQVCDWMREFHAPIIRPDVQKRIITWDWIPQDWMAEPKYFDKDLWYTTDVMREGHVEEEYKRVVSGLDEILAEHGYVRDGLNYRVEQANNDTIVLVCHFGAESVLLSHLMNVSPMILWHNTCALTSSVTTVISEERRKGIANFRVNSFGDLSHLYVHGEEPSFAARFCECYDNEEERHD
ncbi:MAG: histidine phosphatase family protein [Lachnospiraceae bacterium]